MIQSFILCFSESITSVENLTRLCYKRLIYLAVDRIKYFYFETQFKFPNYRRKTGLAF